MIGRLTFTALAVAALTACIGSGTNSPVTQAGVDRFPSVTGIDLTGAERTLPDIFDRRYTLVSVAFEREQQALVDTWIPYGESLEETAPSFAYFEVPVIYEMSAAGRFWVNNGMRSGIPDPDARLRTITVYTDRDRFTDMLDVDMDTITTFLLNDRGEIIWRGSGPLTDAYRAAIEQRIAQ